MSRPTPDIPPFPRPACRQAPSTRLASRGFTMVEVVMATLVIAVLFVAVLNTVGATRTTLVTVGERARATALADALMQEILAQAYRDPDHPDVFGPTEAEAATGNRSLFNDVDDYHGWDASPPEDRHGKTLAEFPNFRRSVTVAWVDPRTLEPDADDTGIKQITVTVTRADKRLATLTTLRTDAARREGQP